MKGIYGDKKSLVSKRLVRKVRKRLARKRLVRKTLARKMLAEEHLKARLKTASGSAANWGGMSRCKEEKLRNVKMSPPLEN